MAAPFVSDRDWVFDIGTAELWDRLTQVQQYSEWWPWLRRFEPDGGFAQGSRWHCEVAPPLPYMVRFTIHLDSVEPGRSATASVHGDVRGEARLTVGTVDDVARVGGGAATSRARLVSRLVPATPLLRGVGRAARPLVEWGHDWVLDQGRRQFVQRAFD